MELTNNRMQYSVTNENESLKLSGEITVSSTKLITSFSGSFMMADGAIAGNFNYSENDTNFDKHIYGVSKSLSDVANTLLDNTIIEIKAKLV